MIYRFADCVLDTRRHVFERGGEERKIEPQVFDLLHVLAANSGELLTREALIEAVWNGLNVSDATISVRIGAARRAIGDSGKTQAVIETVARRGFRMIAEVAIELPGEPGAGTGGRSNKERRELPMLAVMPFEYQKTGPGDRFADGIVDEITAALSRVGAFDVIARQSAYAIAEQKLSVDAAAAQLGADYLVEGSVQRSGERVRINVDLVNAIGKRIWTARFDERLDDLFDLQDRIAASVTGQVAPSVRGAEIARVSYIPDRTAYHLVLAALPHFWVQSEDANERAIALLEQALIRSPDYGPALAYKAWAMAQKPTYMWSKDPRIDKAKALEIAERAALFAGEHAPSLVAIGAAISLTSGDVVRSRLLIDRALLIDPNNAWGWSRSGWTALYEGTPNLALEHFERAERLSPFDPLRFGFLLGRASCNSRLGNLEKAVELVREAMNANPGMNWAYRLLVGYLMLLGRTEEAKIAMTSFLNAYPHVSLDYLKAALPRRLGGAPPAYVDALAKLGMP